MSDSSKGKKVINPIRSKIYLINCCTTFIQLDDICESKKLVIGSLLFFFLFSFFFLKKSLIFIGIV
jgi:hypothetical protein